VVAAALWACHSMHYKGEIALRLIVATLCFSLVAQVPAAAEAEAGCPLLLFALALGLPHPPPPRPPPPPFGAPLPRMHRASRPPPCPARNAGVPCSSWSACLSACLPACLPACLLARSHLGRLRLFLMSCLPAASCRRTTILPSQSSCCEARRLSAAAAAPPHRRLLKPSHAIGVLLGVSPYPTPRYAPCSRARETTDSR